MIFLLKITLRRLCNESLKDSFLIRTILLASEDGIEAESVSNKDGDVDKSTKSARFEYAEWIGEIIKKTPQWNYYARTAVLVKKKFKFK